MILLPPISTLFPYTTLFRSGLRSRRARPRVAARRPSLRRRRRDQGHRDRKSTRLNSSHSSISYAVFCLKKKKQTQNQRYGYFHIDAIAQDISTVVLDAVSGV